MQKSLLLWCLTISISLPLNGAAQVGWGSWLTNLFYKAQNAVVAQYRKAPKTTAAVGVAGIAGLAGLVAAGNALYKRYYTAVPYSYAVTEFQGKRPAMEDADIVAYKYPYMIAAVYDGHGGKEVANILAKGDKDLGLPALHTVIFDKLHNNKNNDSEQQILQESFVSMDRQLFNALVDEQGKFKLSIVKPDGDIIERNYNLSKAGSTAIVALINVQSKRCCFAWAGDARGLIINNKTGAVELATEDHKPSDLEEKVRIEKAGSFVTRQKFSDDNFNQIEVFRVGGILAVSRAFGDFYPFVAAHDNRLGKYRKDNPHDIVSAQADVTRSFDLSNNSYKIFLSCDGVFEADLLTNNDVARIITSKDERDWIAPLTEYRPSRGVVRKVHSQGNSEAVKRITNQVVSQAFEQGSGDNITAMVIDIP